MLHFRRLILLHILKGTRRYVLFALDSMARALELESPEENPEEIPWCAAGAEFVVEFTEFVLILGSMGWISETASGDAWWGRSSAPPTCSPRALALPNLRLAFIPCNLLSWNSRRGYGQTVSSSLMVLLGGPVWTPCNLRFKSQATCLS